MRISASGGPSSTTSTRPLRTMKRLSAASPSRMIQSPAGTLTSVTWSARCASSSSDKPANTGTLRRNPTRCHVPSSPCGACDCSSATVSSPCRRVRRAVHLGPSVRRIRRGGCHARYAPGRLQFHLATPNTIHSGNIVTKRTSGLSPATEANEHVKVSAPTSVKHFAGERHQAAGRGLLGHPAAKYHGPLHLGPKRAPAAQPSRASWSGCGA